MRLATLSGQEARAWRRRVAASATKPASHIRTLKFPLEKTGPDPLPPDLFDKAQALYAITEGVGNGSLLGLLTAIHLCGFRFYDNATKAGLFRSERLVPNRVSPETFKNAFHGYFGIPPKDFTPDGIFNAITAKPRGSKATVPSFTAEFLADRFHALARKKSIASDKKPVQPFVDLVTCFARKLSTTFSCFDDLSRFPSQALALFDAACSECATPLPSIAHHADGMVEMRPETSPIDFDTLLPATLPSPTGDMALHQVVAQKLRLALQTGQSLDSAKEAASFCKAAITTSNHNALSWVFGTGMSYWRSSSLDDIMRDYAIPPDRQSSILQLKTWFLSLTPSPLFAVDRVNYADFRKVVGGKVDSWISNYITRLWDIRAALDELKTASDFLPPELDEPAMVDTLSGLGFSVHDVRRLIRQLHRMHDQATQALDRLQGRSDNLPLAQDRERIEDLNERLDDIHGRLNMITERIRRKAEDGELPEQFSMLTKWELPKWLGGYSRLNNISGGPIDARAELDAGLARFTALRQAMTDMAEKALAWARNAGALTPPLDARAAIEQGRAAQNGRTLPDATNLARRWLWQRLASAARTGSPILSSAVRHEFSGIGFTRRKNLNKFLCNHQGQLYKSPYSTKRHLPYDVDETVFAASDPVTAIRRVFLTMAREAETSVDPAIHGDELRMANLHYSLLLAGLPADVPVSFIPPNLTSLLRVPTALAVHLHEKTVSRDLFLKLFNLFQSELKGLQNLLFRTEFMLRTRFTQIGWDTLLLAPKDRGWIPPSHLTATDKPIGHALRFLAEGIDDTGRAMDKLAASDLFTAHTGHHPWTAFLKEAPHDWLVNLPLRGMTHSLKALPAGKNGLGKPTIHTGGLFRLVGPSSYKGVLDAWLTSSDMGLKEYTLLIEQTYAQTTRRENGALVIELQPTRMNLVLSLPVEQPAPSNAEFPMAETIIGIDLGEIGIAYHVVNARTFEPVASGTLRIKSIRGLMHAVKRFRGARQPRQKFQQRLSTHLAELRENVAGDVRHHIDSLCALYKGFPVLESSVRNLASGAKQLVLVYDKIINTYAFSGIDAHKTARGHHWLGSLDWRHPFLEGIRPETGNKEPLRLFPGVTIAPKWTSQVCSHCRRQPYEAVRRTYGENGKNISILEGGKVGVDDGTLLLKRRIVTPTEAKLARRQKRRPPLDQAHGPGKIATKDLVFALRQQVRQPSESTRSKDTTQSVFHCPYEDCGHVMHADENAAINITRKWINEKLHTGEAWRKSPAAEGGESAVDTATTGMYQSGKRDRRSRR